jgi:hypothetical protein
MSVAIIFAQIHDWTAWPPVPERPLLPADMASLRPAELRPPREPLQPWRPPATPEDADG